MLYTLLIVIALTAFISGFAAGNLYSPKRLAKYEKHKPENLIFAKEYENFLNYNGDEQP